MNAKHIENLTTEQLVAEFTRLAAQRGAAILDSETRQANELFDGMRAIERVLRARGEDARMSLAPLLQDRDRFVRYFAAKYLLGLLPREARAVIEGIANPKFDALSLDAGMSLYALDAGIFKPD